MFGGSKEASYWNALSSSVLIQQTIRYGLSWADVAKTKCQQNCKGEVLGAENSTAVDKNSPQRLILRVFSASGKDLDCAFLHSTF